MRTKIALISRDDGVRRALAGVFAGAPESWQVGLYEQPPEAADIVVCGPDVDVPGGVRFDPQSPRRVLAEVAARTRAAGASLVLVTGAAGGVGTTAVALHLGAEFARRAKTCVVDLDPLGGVALRLGIEGIEPGPDSQPAPAGFRLIHAPGAGRPELERAAVDFERVVADLPYGRAALDACARATAVLVVAPTPAGARRAADLLDEAPEARWAVVVNRLGPGGETTVRDVERIMGRRVALELPCSPALRDAEDDARILGPGWSRWARRIGLLARALERR